VRASVPRRSCIVVVGTDISITWLSVAKTVIDRYCGFIGRLANLPCVRNVDAARRSGSQPARLRRRPSPVGIVTLSVQSLLLENEAVAIWRTKRSMT
jgi:hypothetical protein